VANGSAYDYPISFVVTLGGVIVPPGENADDFHRLDPRLVGRLPWEHCYPGWRTYGVTDSRYKDRVTVHLGQEMSDVRCSWAHPSRVATRETIDDAGDSGIV
jgi:hypothetical protein